MKHLFGLGLAILTVVMFSGCVSAMIERAAARGREVLQPGTRREAIAAHFGEPYRGDLPERVFRDPDRAVVNYHGGSYTVWRIRGRPAQVDDGAGAATVNAMTLGTGEVVMLPFAVLSAGSSAFKTFYLVCVFDRDGRLQSHRSYVVD